MYTVVRRLGVQVEKSVFFIMGCQRSGSTLLESIFNAHPSVHVVGEESMAAYGFFDAPHAVSAISKPVIGLRIPAATHRIDYATKAYPSARVLFTMRDPRDVVTSMRKLLTIRRDIGQRGSWLELFGQDEIENCLDHLPPDEPLLASFRALRQKTDDHNDARYGALCWALKNRFLPLYQASVLQTAVVRYEQLTNDSEQCLRQICAFLELEWHDNLLHHQHFSSGTWAGTDKGAPIHQRSLEAYRRHLTRHEQQTVHSLIGHEMVVSGYGDLCP